MFEEKSADRNKWIVQAVFNEEVNTLSSKTLLWIRMYSAWYLARDSELPQKGADSKKEMQSVVIKMWKAVVASYFVI